MVQEQFQAQPKSFKLPRYLFIILGIIVFVLITEGVYFFWLKRKPKKEPIFCPELDSLVFQFADAKREIGKEEVVYTFEGKLVGMELKGESAIYQLDLGKGVLLGQPQAIKIPLKVLPKKYFDKQIENKEDLNLEESQLNLLVQIKLKHQKPCQLTEWSVETLFLAAKLKVLTPKEGYQKIARQTLDWLNKERDERGVYTLGKLCRISGQCEMAAQDNRAGLAAIWGRFKYYQAYKEKKDMEILNRDLEIYNDPDKIPVIQNDFWNCKLMYQIWQSDLISDWQKKAIEEICWLGAYPPEEEELVPEPDLSLVMEKRSVPLKSPVGLSASGGEMSEFAAFSSDFSSRFLWKKEEEDLEKAVFFFNKAVNLYDKETSQAYLSGRWLLGIAALDLYQANEEGQYLEFAIALSEKEAIKDICVIDTSPPNYCQESLLERTTANLFLRQLFEATGEEEHKNISQELTERTIETAFDKEGYEGVFMGDGSFNTFGRGISIEGVNVYKDIRANGLMVGILSENY